MFFNFSYYFCLRSLEQLQILHQLIFEIVNMKVIMIAQQI